VRETTQARGWVSQLRAAADAERVCPSMGLLTMRRSVPDVCATARMYGAIHGSVKRSSCCRVPNALPLAPAVT
jgi:hypothetical protein